MVRRAELRRRLASPARWLGAAAGALLAWGLLEPLVLTIEKHRARVPKLPASWEGEKVVLLSDLHVGMPLASERALRRAVQRTLLERPRLVLLGGDFVHGDRGAVERVASLLRPLAAAGLDCYAVLGNHDYAMPNKDSSMDDSLASHLASCLTAAGIRVLHNETLLLPGSGEPLHLVGLGSHTARRDRPAEVLKKLPPDAPRIVLMHHPATFDACPADLAPFAVAGHTHGGQVRLPMSPVQRRLAYGKEIETLLGGWIDHVRIEGFGAEGNRLYVSRGVGCSVAPVRLFCPPELTIFTLAGV